jgi:hypothetical protein
MTNLKLYTNYLTEVLALINNGDGTIRDGQNYYNHANSYFHNIIDFTEIVATDIDPFHIDNNIDKFLEFIVKKLEL